MSLMDIGLGHSTVQAGLGRTEILRQLCDQFVCLAGEFQGTSLELRWVWGRYPDSSAATIVARNQVSGKAFSGHPPRCRGWSGSSMPMVLLSESPRSRMRPMKVPSAVWRRCVVRAVEMPLMSRRRCQQGS